MSARKILFNGPIITMDENQPRVEAVGIEGEKIIAVGDLEHVKTTLGNGYVSIDLEGHSLLPGFIDSHMHPISTLFLFINLDLSSITSLEELQEFLRSAAKEREKEEVVFGFRLKEEMFEIPKLPTRWDLDVACPDSPVFILRYDGHIGIANSKTLELVGITPETEVPNGGEIRRNKNGELTGVISENALSILYSKISKYLVPKTDKLQETAEKLFNGLAKRGITSFHGVTTLQRDIPVYKMVQDIIPQSYYSLIPIDDPLKIIELRKQSLDTNKEDSKFKLRCWKGYFDGTLGAKTALMHEDFSDAPGMRGFSLVNEEHMYNRMKVVHANGLQMGVHAIGDKGNRLLVDLYKRLLEEFPKENHRHRIEHGSLLTADVIKDIKKYNIIVASQPPFINSEYTWLEKRLGKARCKYIYPFKSLIDAGVILSSGSDSPIEDPDIIQGLHALVTRNGFVPEECITMEEALKTYTINGAYAAFEENIKGSIEIGKLADLVVLDKNPLTVNNEEIKNLQILETIIRGKTVYKKED
ncbi:MAG: amidohydrolase [Promethearchaeota archaeon]|jgi:predicted amidohydrolase YtcJ